MSERAVHKATEELIEEARVIVSRQSFCTLNIPSINIEIAARFEGQKYLIRIGSSRASGFVSPYLRWSLRK